MRLTATLSWPAPCPPPASYERRARRLLTVYGKAAKEDLTSDDKQAIRALRDAHAAWREIEAAALNATAHLRGERQRREYVVTVPDTVDVAGLRAALGLSQGAFGI